MVVSLHQGIWVFGYGSLVWKPSFEYKQSIKGYVRGWRRVWWQGSTDHRGTPEKPGRTVTLIQEPDAITWGIAYELAGTVEQQQETLSYLEWREKQYDIRCHTQIYSNEGNASGAVTSSPRQNPMAVEHQVVVPDCLVYIAGPDPSRNSNYLGPAPLKDIANQIAASIGPSGPNHEYLYGLADAMRDMGVWDEELFELEGLVKERIRTYGNKYV